MTRKRKIPLREVDTNNMPNNNIVCDKNSMLISEIKKIFNRIQSDLTSEKNYIRELRRMYTEMEHNEFMKIINSTLQVAMQQPEDDINSNTLLQFLCNFLASYKDDEDENPCRSVFNMVLNTDGANPHIRFRLCQLVNTLLSSLGTEAALDDGICDQILSYMLNRLKNSSPHVRAQAIYALERLQVPDDPDDIVIKYFTYHLQADPSAKVRQAVISKIARNVKTIPLIIERLTDADERVRRHTYIEMMKGFPVKSFRVAQRLTFLECGLMDESKSIRKIVAHLMITEWLLSYSEDYISFLRALKLNGTDEDLQRFHKTSKNALREIFKKTPLNKLLLPLAFQNEANKNTGDEVNEDEEDDEPPPIQLKFCVPIEHITLEHSVFWVNLAEYLFEEKSNEIDLLLPDLTTYCEYLTSYYNLTPNADTSMDEWEELERGYILTNLVSNLQYFDYSEDIGKKNLKDFIFRILKECDLNDSSIKILLKILGTIVPDCTDRFQQLNNIIIELYKPDTFEFISDRPSMKLVLENEANSNILLSISELKFNIMDLKEQTLNFLAEKDYENFEKTTEELNNFKTSYIKLLMPYLKFLSEDEAKSVSLSVEKVSSSTVAKCLKIVFYMVASENVSALTPAICPLYSDFIRRFTESNQLGIRRLALKCGTAFAILYEQFSQDMFVQLRKQFLLNPCKQIWEVSIRAIFQLLVRYDLQHFDVVDRNKSRNSTSKSARQLYRGHEYFSQEDEDDSVVGTSHANLLSLMSHILDTCTDIGISNTVIEGFCLLCLNGNCSYAEIISKLMIKYFDPATDSKANQLLGMFFNSLIAQGKSLYLEAALLPTITEILDAGYESTLGEVKPENVIRFVINATSPKYSLPGINIHESIAESFLKEIQENLCTKLSFVKVLSSELIRLHLHETSETLKSKFLKKLDEIFTDYTGEEKIKKNLINFQKLLNGEFTMIAANDTNEPQSEIIDKSGVLTIPNPGAVANRNEDHVSVSDEEEDEIENEQEDNTNLITQVNGESTKINAETIDDPILLSLPSPPPSNHKEFTPLNEEPSQSVVPTTPSTVSELPQQQKEIATRNIRNLRKSLNPVLPRPSTGNNSPIPASQDTPVRRYGLRNNDNNSPIPASQDTPVRRYGLRNNDNTMEVSRSAIDNQSFIAASQVSPVRRYGLRNSDIIQQSPTSIQKSSRKTRRRDRGSVSDSMNTISKSNTPVQIPAKKTKPTDTDSSSSSDGSRRSSRIAEGSPKKIIPDFIYTTVGKRKRSSDRSATENRPNPYIQIKKLTPRRFNQSEKSPRTISNGVMSVDRTGRPATRLLVQMSSVRTRSTSSSLKKKL